MVTNRTMLNPTLLPWPEHTRATYGFWWRQKNYVKIVLNYFWALANDPTALTSKSNHNHNCDYVPCFLCGHDYCDHSNCEGYVGCSALGDYDGNSTGCPCGNW